ncbi:MAG: FAD-dependent monooxygenase [Devosia sp.]|nr:FAD-dependent monooxygenase [Devosia sp.]
MTTERFDAVVIGGGLAGRAAALAVAKAGLDTLHLAPAGPADRRTSALMGPSVAFLQSLGVVDDPPSSGHPLRQIRIIDATSRLLRAPETVFDSAEAGLAAFGWNFANVALAEAFERLAAGLPHLTSRPLAAATVAFGEAGARVTLADGAGIDASLLIGADGKKSMVREAAGITVREHVFSQAALVCDLTLSRPLGDQSVEFHYDRGPFTLVPAGGNHANLVWIDDRAVLDSARGSEATLLEALTRRSQRLFGTIGLASPAFVFPLSSLSVDRAGAKGVVLVGEAAHAFPPIGAQGLNLGLRDVADLVALIGASGGPLDARRGVALSQAYARRRSGDLVRTGATVDTLFRSLLADLLPAQAARAGGLWALKLVPALRRQAFAIGMGAR